AVGGRAAAASLSRCERGNLRQPRLIGPPLVAFVLEEEAVRRLRARAGEPHKRDGTVRVLDGELQCGPQLVGVERPMAGLVLPTRALLDELCVANVLPLSH